MLRVDAKREFEWEQAAAIRATIYDMLRDSEKSKPSHKLPPRAFDPTEGE